MKQPVDKTWGRGRKCCAVCPPYAVSYAVLNGSEPEAMDWGPPGVLRAPGVAWLVGAQVR